MMSNYAKKEFFENNLKNAPLIYLKGGDLPIEPASIGKIVIRPDKTVMIEIRQLKKISKKYGGDWYSVPFYALGHLLCRNCECISGETQTSGALFRLERNCENRLKILANHNRQGILIECDSIEVLDFDEVEIGIEEYWNMEMDMGIGKFFSIVKDL